MRDSVSIDTADDKPLRLWPPDCGGDQINYRVGVLVGIDDPLLPTRQNVVVTPPAPQLALSEISASPAVVAAQRLFERQIESEELRGPTMISGQQNQRAATHRYGYGAHRWTKLGTAPPRRH